jgi:ribose transport system permease protein
MSRHGGTAGLKLRIALFGLLLSGLALSLGLPAFSTAANLDALMREAAPAAIVAIGQSLVLIAGGIDLSVGAVAGFAGVVLAVASRAGLPLWGAVPLILAIGAGIGLWHGFGIGRLRVPPFIMTLASFALLRGLGALLTGGMPIAGLPAALTSVVRRPVLGIPAMFWMAMLVAIAAYAGLHRSRAGRYLFAIGSDAEAARLAGVDVPRIRTAAYMLSSLLAALAGLLATGTGRGLESIAAALLGGTSLFGGIGSVPGTLLGSLLLSTLGNGAQLLTAQMFWPPIIAGAVIVAAVAVERRRRG